MKGCVIENNKFENLATFQEAESTVYFFQDLIT